MKRFFFPLLNFMCALVKGSALKSQHHDRVVSTKRGRETNSKPLDKHFWF